MKKKTNIRTVIRQIVREEVAMAINEVITELKQPTRQVSQPKAEKKVVEGKRTYKKFTENSVLNDILNETAQDDEWKTLGGGTYDSNKVNDVLSSAYSDINNSNPNGNLAAEMGVNPNQPGMDFLKKDYRAVMKAVDKKSKQKRGM
tara:strand:+ start:111 stop:548 length:438 start_codon:yes stop_codon:yes gene_type:complete